MYQRVAERFQYIMELRNIKSSELAERSGINKSSISQYVNGHNVPKQDRAEKLGKILNVDPLWLRGYSVEMNSNIKESNEFLALEFDQIAMHIDKEVNSFVEWLLDDVINYEDVSEIEDLRKDKGDKMARLALYSLILKKLSNKND